MGRKRSTTSTNWREVYFYFWMGAVSLGVLQFLIASFLVNLSANTILNGTGNTIFHQLHRQASAKHTVSQLQRNHIFVEPTEFSQKTSHLRKVEPSSAEAAAEIKIKNKAQDPPKNNNHKRPRPASRDVSVVASKETKKNEDSAPEKKTTQDAAMVLATKRKEKKKKKLELTKIEIAKVLDETEQHVPFSDSMTVNPILAPIIHAGKMYSMGRQDRSGSVISDMLYAHAYAFAHNVTYAGACFMTKRFPRNKTLNLLQHLHWNHVLPFVCPADVDPHLNLSHPDATALSPLILNADVYRHKIEQSFFTAAWRESIQSVMAEHPNAAALRADRPFEIAVHVRRGDVSPCTYKRRYLPNAHYLKLIDQYTPAASERNNRPVHVTIYSESDSFEPFDVFRERNCTLELDTEDLSVVWKALVTADVVILSRSYFSFVPATVNPHTIVATHFFQMEPLPGWKAADDALVKASDKQTRQMFKTRCNVTATDPVEVL